MKVLTLATMLLCSSAAMAHYTLDYPPSRGFSDDDEPIAPCGGTAYNAAGNRTQFPLTNGFVQISSFHPSASVQVNIAYGNNPTAADFTTASSTPVDSVQVTHPFQSCLPLNLTSVAGAANNVNATIQLIYNGGDSPLYQCADVVLVTAAPSFNQSMCIDNSGSTPSATSPGAPKSTSGASAFSVKGAAATTAAAVFFAAAMIF
ncbi:hypothetical protein EC957_011272 [Mortierella hygrophila]|uniref:Copper acquisition factor BIM1-like domain-containing protein n=1 Tax=Mortierella hygrophila TaxID=979708 RepID=A0A9P6F813_9FUNG|nr:hypothetical protein EC957_011272 [Mortierella hygrophila]